MRASSAFKKATSNGALWMMSSASRMNSRNSPCTCEKGRFLGQTLARQPMHLNRAFIDLALRVQILMEGPARQAAVEQLHATDFDDAVLLLNLEPRGFRIENDLRAF